MKKEIIFGRMFCRETIRCHAEVVDALPEKDERARGYYRVGMYKIGSCTYTWRSQVRENKEGGKHEARGLSER